MEIKKVPITEVEVWEKNLKVRATKKEAYDRTKAQIVELGIYKPATAFIEDGKYYILGGRLRFFIIKDLGHTDIDLSIVHPKTDADKWKYVISDNDESSEWLQQELAEEIYLHREELDLESLNINISEPVNLKNLIENVSPEADGRESNIPTLLTCPKCGESFTYKEARQKE